MGPQRLSISPFIMARTYNIHIDLVNIFPQRGSSHGWFFMNVVDSCRFGIEHNFIFFYTFLSFVNSLLCKSSFSFKVKIISSNPDTINDGNDKFNNVIRRNVYTRFEPLNKRGKSRIKPHSKGECNQTCYAQGHLQNTWPLSYSFRLRLGQSKSIRTPILRRFFFTTIPLWRIFHVKLTCFGTTLRFHNLSHVKAST